MIGHRFTSADIISFDDFHVHHSLILVIQTEFSCHLLGVLYSIDLFFGGLRICSFYRETGHHDHQENKEHIRWSLLPESRRHHLISLSLRCWYWVFFLLFPKSPGCRLELLSRIDFACNHCCLTFCSSFYDFLSLLFLVSSSSLVVNIMSNSSDLPISWFISSDSSDDAKRWCFILLLTFICSGDAEYHHCSFHSPNDRLPCH